MDQRSYARGYQAGMKRVIKGAWPDYGPPLPPDANTREVVAALIRLADAVATVLGVVIADEPVFQELKDAAENADVSLQRLTEWLRELRLPDSAGLVHE